MTDATPAEVRRALLGIESPEHDIQRRFFKPGWQREKERAMSDNDECEALLSDQEHCITHSEWWPPGEDHCKGWPTVAPVEPAQTAACVVCGRHRTPADREYSPLQVMTGQPLGWYSGDDGEICPEDMERAMSRRSKEHKSP
jgi:hypothetical protein